MPTQFVAQFIDSTPEDSRIRRKVAKAAKRLRNLKSKKFRQAETSFSEAKSLLADTSLAFENLLGDFSRAITNFGNPAPDSPQPPEDADHTEVEHEKAEDKLAQALKIYRRTMKDFSRAREILEQVEETAEEILESMQSANFSDISIVSVRLYLKEQSENSEP